RTRDAEAQRAGLARGAAARDAGDHVVAAGQLEERERVVDELLVQLVREVVLERAAVDGERAGAGDQAHAGDGLLATADGLAADVDDAGRLGSLSCRRLGREALGSLDGVCDLRHVWCLLAPYWATWSNV